MVTYTTATGLTLVANSSYVGTWDVPENANWSVVDSRIGGATTIALTNSNVVLTTAQAQCKTIILTGALSGHCYILFPTVTPSGTTITGTYTVINRCTNITTYLVLLRNSAGGNHVCAPPSVPTDVFNDGTHFYFKGLDPVGTFWDVAATAIPIWISNSAVPPYLYCDGSAFSAVTYPALAAMMGTTTLPDTRGRYRLNWNVGTGRTNVNSAINADVPFSGGGYQYSLNGTFIPYMYNGNYMYDPTHNHTGSTTASAIASNGAYQYGGGNGAVNGGNTITIDANYTGITVGTISNVPLYMPPSYVGGLTMIRAG